MPSAKKTLPPSPPGLSPHPGRSAPQARTVNKVRRKVSMIPEILLSLWWILNILKLGCQGILEGAEK